MWDDESNNFLNIKELLKDVTYRDGWKLSVFAIGSHDGVGRIYSALKIEIECEDSQKDDKKIQLEHRFQIPPFLMDEDETLRWILDCIITVERHEACEWLKVKGVSPFLPDHDFDGDPYRIPEPYSHTTKVV